MQQSRPGLAGRRLPAGETEAIRRTVWLGPISICQESKTRLLISRTGTRSFSTVNRPRARSLLPWLVTLLRDMSAAGSLARSLYRRLAPSVSVPLGGWLPPAHSSGRRIVARQSYRLMAVASYSAARKPYPPPAQPAIRESCAAVRDKTTASPEQTTGTINYTSFLSAAAAAAAAAAGLGGWVWFIELQPAERGPVFEPNDSSFEFDDAVTPLSRMFRLERRGSAFETPELPFSNPHYVGTSVHRSRGSGILWPGFVSLFRSFLPRTFPRSFVSVRSVGTPRFDSRSRLIRF